MSIDITKYSEKTQNIYNDLIATDLLQSEIAKKNGVSRERVRQIKNKLLGKDFERKNHEMKLQEEIVTEISKGISTAEAISKKFNVKLSKVNILKSKYCKEVKLPRQPKPIIETSKTSEIKKLLKNKNMTLNEIAKETNTTKNFVNVVKCRMKKEGYVFEDLRIK